MSVLLALGAAFAFGSGDFAGGIATRRWSALQVIVVTHAIGLVTGLSLAVVIDGTPTARDIAFGLLAGVAGAIGIALFYSGMAIGAMSVVAPLAAVTNAVVPAVVGFGMGDRVGGGVGIGLGMAVTSIGLVSIPQPTDIGGRPQRADLGAALFGVGAGAAFGCFFLAFDAVGDGSGMWALVAVRVSSLSIATGVAARRRSSLRPPRGVRRAVVFAGLADQAANAMLLLATRRGDIAIVAVIASLYPAVTVLLAQSFLGERLRSVQYVGLGAGLGAVLLIALG